MTLHLHRSAAILLLLGLLAGLAVAGQTPPSPDEDAAAVAPTLAPCAPDPSLTAPESEIPDWQGAGNWPGCSAKPSAMTNPCRSTGSSWPTVPT